MWCFCPKSGDELVTEKSEEIKSAVKRQPLDYIKDEVVKKSAPILETEEEKIIREEEEQNRAAMEEDNVSE